MMIGGNRMPDRMTSGLPAGAAREHGLLPVTGSCPKILILGSFPSKKSLEQKLYYANPRNQFWCIMAALFPPDDPGDTASALESLKEHHIALWDVIASRAFQPGSMDHATREIIPNDIPAFIRDRPTIRCVAVNGRMAWKLLDRTYPSESFPAGVAVLPLPSTSPANARLSFDQKLSEWRVITGFLD